jgi:hypothetical protein
MQGACQAALTRAPVLCNHVAAAVVSLPVVRSLSPLPSTKPKPMGRIPPPPSEGGAVSRGRHSTNVPPAARQPPKKSVKTSVNQQMTQPQPVEGGAGAWMLLGLCPVGLTCGTPAGCARPSQLCLPFADLSCCCCSVTGITAAAAAARGGDVRAMLPTAPLLVLRLGSLRSFVFLDPSPAKAAVSTATTCTCSSSSSSSSQEGGGAVSQEMTPTQVLCMLVLVAFGRAAGFMSPGSCQH